VWDGDGALTTTTTCLENCELQTAPENGGVGNCADVAHDASCEPECDLGFTASSSLTCSVGVLTPPVVWYLSTTGGPYDASVAPTNGAIGTCSSTLASGTICKPKCDVGFYVSGPGFSHCDGGNFTSATCLAEPAYDASVPPVNGGAGDCTSVLASRSTCLPTCDTGFTLQGVSACAYGTLTAAKCVPPSPPSPPPRLVADDYSSAAAAGGLHVALACAVVALAFQGAVD